MGKVVAEATVSLDGYVAGPNESGFEHLFAWFAGGDFEFPSSDPDFKVRLTEPDHRYMRDVVEGIGVFVIGRRMFDLNDGWGGRHPFDKPMPACSDRLTRSVGGDEGPRLAREPRPIPCVACRDRDPLPHEPTMPRIETNTNRCRDELFDARSGQLQGQPLLSEDGEDPAAHAKSAVRPEAGPLRNERIGAESGDELFETRRISSRVRAPA
jgi:hypothetical protein